jgi:hypothetical protein
MAGARGVAAVAAALLVSRAVSAQCTEGCTALHTLTGEAVGDQFGWKSNALGDLTGDGVSDFVVTALTNDGGGGNAGRAYVYSGATGAELFRVSGAGANWQLGRDANAAGDVNDDGVPDLIVGAATSGTGRAIIFSGVSQ